MSELWQTVLGIIASVGGASVLIWAVVKFSANRLADLLLQKYQAKLDQELETFKGELEKQKESFRVKADKTRYVSKVRFDTEFSLCRELMAAAHNMVNYAYLVYPMHAKYPADPMMAKKYKEEIWENAKKFSDEFTLLVQRNAPFISKNVYSAFMELHSLCYENIETYAMKWDKGFMGNWETSQEKREMESKAYIRSRDITKKLDDVIEKLREHFAQMDVNE